MGNGRGWGMRQPVQVTEQVNLESNWWLPLLKAWFGVTISVFMFLAASGLLVWLIPPDLALQVGFWVAIGLGIVFAVIAIVRWADPHPSFFYGFVGVVLAGAAAWGLGGLPDTWWMDAGGLWMWIQASILLGLMMGGGSGAYWFVKELYRQYELTGRELLQKELADREFERQREVEDREWDLKIAEQQPTGTKEWTIIAAITIRDEKGIIERAQPQILHFDTDKVSDAKFAYWATMILRGEGPGYPTWVASRRFVRGPYDHLIEVMTDAGGIAKDGKATNSPLYLTDKGERLLTTWLLAWNQVEIANYDEGTAATGLLEDIDDDRIIEGKWEVRVKVANST